VVTPDPSTLTAIDETVQLSAVAEDGNGNTVTGETFTWVSTVLATATVDAAGLATAVGNGSTSIEATAGGVTGTASLTVTQTATALIFNVHPVTTVAGTAFLPAVQIAAFDGNGNIALNFSATVTVVRNDLIDCEGTPLGTTSVAAASGVAVFSNLFFEQSCGGIRLEASAGALTSLPSNPFSILPAGPTMIQLISGDAQSAAPSTPLTNQLIVQVTDVFGNGVPGFDVTWIVAGGGSLLASSTVTDAAGFATNQWTLGSSTGTNLVEVSAAALTGSPVVFTAVATPAGTSNLWIGGDLADPTNWSVAANWSANAVPTGADDVYIPQPAAAPDQPVVTTQSVVNRLTLEAGATLAVNDLVVLTANGDVDAGSTTGLGTVELAGINGTVLGSLPNVIVSGTITLAGDVTVNGSMVVIGIQEVGDASIAPAGNTLTITGDFTTDDGTGLLLMGAAADIVNVAGNVTFAGASTDGLMTDGTLVIGGDFAQSSGGAGNGFRPTLSHSTVFTGTAPQSVSFDNPGSSTLASRFHNVEFAGPSNVTLSTTINVGETLLVSAPITLTATNSIFMNGFTGSLTTVNGSTLDVANEIRTAGSLAVAGGFSVLTTFFQGTNQIIPADLPYTNLTVFGNAASFGSGAPTISGNLMVGRLNNFFIGNLTLAGATTVLGNVTVTASSGSVTNLIVNGQDLIIGGDLRTQATGVLTMTNGADSVVVTGNATFSGGNLGGRLTAGALDLHGNFTQSINATVYRPSGSHRTIFSGSDPDAHQVIGFVNADTVTGSYFHHLELANTGLGVRLNGTTFARGQLVTRAAVVPNLIGNGRTLVSTGLDVDGLVLDNVAFTSNGGALTLFDNVTLQNYALTATQLTINHPGTSVPFAFNNTTFTVEPTLDVGFYISANDTDTDANPLIIDMVGSDPLDGSPFTATSGGAVVNWPNGVATVTVIPGDASISGVGATQTFAAEARNADGTLLPGTIFTWSSLNPSVATIDPVTGVATTVAAGQATIQAETNGVLGFALLTVSVTGATQANVWASVPSGTTNNLQAVWGSSANDVFAVGDGGTIRHFDGSSWTVMPSGTSATLLGVWGTGPDDVFAVGVTGTIRHFADGNWTSMASPTTRNLFGVWGSAPNDVFAVGFSGEIAHNDGTEWRVIRTGTGNFQDNLQAVCGTSSTDVFTVGGSGGILRSSDGTTWEPMTSNTTQTFRGMWGTAPNNVFAVASGGVIRRFTGSDPWTTMSSQTSDNFASVWGSASDDVYAVGATGSSPGQIHRFNGTQWVALGSGTANILRGVWGTASGNVFTVGEGGVILQGHRGASVSVTPATATLTSSGQTVSLTATAQDAISNPITGVSFTWFSSNTGVATVTASGVVTAVDDGTALVIATSPGGAADTATITVTIVPPAIVLSQSAVSLSALAEGTSVSVPVNITNGGGGILFGLAATVVSYSPDLCNDGVGNACWLEADLNVTVAPATLTLTASPTGSAPGTGPWSLIGSIHMAVVQVSSAVSAQDEFVQVEFSVSEPPGPPILTGIAVIVNRIESPSCSLFPTRLGTEIDINFDYHDPDGDFPSIGSAISGTFVFIPQGETGGSSFLRRSIFGDRFNGQVETRQCLVWGTNTSVDVTIVVTDGASNQSSFTVNIPRPAGSN